jgi:predicted Rossmann-fold nucleotide-binding protein
MNIESVAVFCGSNSGKNPLFTEHVKELGKLLAMLNWFMEAGIKG